MSIGDIGSVVKAIATMHKNVEVLNVRLEALDKQLERAEDGVRQSIGLLHKEIGKAREDGVNAHIEHERRLVRIETILDFSSRMSGLPQLRNTDDDSGRRLVGPGD